MNRNDIKIRPISLKRSMRNLFIFSLFCAMFASGCAFTDAHVRLTYEPAGSLTSNNKTEIFVMPFSDSRTEKKIIGPVRNGLGDKTADVVLAEGQNVSQWITDALIAELSLAGFNAKQSESDSLSGLIVLGDLTGLAFDTTPDFKHHATLNLSTEVQNIRG